MSTNRQLFQSYIEQTEQRLSDLGNYFALGGWEAEAFLEEPHYQLKTADNQLLLNRYSINHEPAYRSFLDYYEQGLAKSAVALQCAMHDDNREAGFLPLLCHLCSNNIVILSTIAEHLDISIDEVSTHMLMGNDSVGALVSDVQHRILNSNTSKVASERLVTDRLATKIGNDIAQGILKYHTAGQYFNVTDTTDIINQRLVDVDIADAEKNNMLNRISNAIVEGGLSGIIGVQFSQLSAPVQKAIGNFRKASLRTGKENFDAIAATIIDPEIFGGSDYEPPYNKVEVVSKPKSLAALPDILRQHVQGMGLAAKQSGFTANFSPSPGFEKIPQGTRSTSILSNGIHVHESMSQQQPDGAVINIFLNKDGTIKQDYLDTYMNAFTAFMAEAGGLSVNQFTAANRRKDNSFAAPDHWSIMEHDNKRSGGAIRLISDPEQGPRLEVRSADVLIEPETFVAIISGATQHALEQTLVMHEFPIPITETFIAQASDSDGKVNLIDLLVEFQENQKTTGSSNAKDHDNDHTQAIFDELLWSVDSDILTREGFATALQDCGFCFDTSLIDRLAKGVLTSPPTSQTVDAASTRSMARNATEAITNFTDGTIAKHYFPAEIIAVLTTDMRRQDTEQEFSNSMGIQYFDYAAQQVSMR